MSSTSNFPSSSSDNSVPSSTGSSARSGNSPSATLLFGFLVIFVTLFMAFLLLGFFWHHRRHSRDVLEFDEAKGAYKGVPKLWEVWVEDEPNQWEWESIRPLSVSVDVDRAPTPPAVSPAPTSHSRPLFRNPFRPQPVPTAPQAQHGGTGAEASVPISGVRMSFIIAMPYAGAPNRRRSEISQLSRVGENWRHRDYAIGVYHPPFREGFAL